MECFVQRADRLFSKRPFVACHSRSTKPLCWRVNVALGQDKQRKLLFKTVCLLFFLSKCDFSSPARWFREWLKTCSFFSLKYNWKVTRVTSKIALTIGHFYFCLSYNWNDKIVSCAMLELSSDLVTLLWPVNSRC